MKVTLALCVILAVCATALAMPKKDKKRGDPKLSEQIKEKIEDSKTQKEASEALTRLLNHNMKKEMKKVADNFKKEMNEQIDNTLKKHVESAEPKPKVEKQKPAIQKVANIADLYNQAHQQAPAPAPQTNYPGYNTQIVEQVHQGQQQPYYGQSRRKK